MKRMHIHLSVSDLEENIRFYNTLFRSEPTVQKHDYAKWMLDDPRVNFAISARGRGIGLDHLGIQTDDDLELGELKARLDRAGTPILEQQGAGCCYAVSDKYWTRDPQGIAWESFHTLGEIPVFGDGKDLSGQSAASSACCAPNESVQRSRCCG